MPSQPSSTRPAPRHLWDIFCRVIDNFGDLGVCWRLSRQLAVEYQQTVRLWVDEPATLAPLLGRTDVDRPTFTVDGVEIHHWTAPFPDISPGDVVIEAFACELPESFLRAMADRDSAPHWFNLEYLSAEPWVDDCHAVHSPHPQLPLVKTFFFPGFSPRTGGLLREKSLSPPAFSAPEQSTKPFTVSLFCYDDAPLGDLVMAMAKSPRPIHLLVPPGKPKQALHAHFGESIPAQFGAVRIEPIAFRSQDAYDALLRECDLNFVRGEDSFVRAQWTARPFVWQAYRQADDAHLDKLDAFLTRYTADMDSALAQCTAHFFRAWNTGKAVATHWPTFFAAQTALQTSTQRWTAKLFQLPDLAANLMKAAEKPV